MLTSTFLSWEILPKLYVACIWSVILLSIQSVYFVTLWWNETKNENYIAKSTAWSTERGGTTVVVVALIRWQHSCNMYALNYGHKCLIVSIFHGKDHKVHFQQTIIWYLGNGTCHENERTKLFYFYHITTKSYLKDQLHCGMQNSIFLNLYNHHLIIYVELY